MSRTTRAVNNISWGVLQKIIMMGLPFISRTILMKYLGVDYLGLSGLFTSILSLLSLTELGVSSAIISSLYKPIAEKDNDVICALMAFYRRAYHLIGGIIAALGIAVLPFLNKFINGAIPSDINIYVLYGIYLFNTVISYFLFAYKNCLFIAHQRDDINSKVHLLGTIVQYIVQIGLIITFRNYYLYAVVIPLISVFKNIITAMWARKEYPEYICRGTLSKEIRAELKKKVAGLMLANTSATIRSSIDSLFISMFLGLRMVAMYSNYFYIVTSIVGIIQILQSAIVAGVGNSIATESVEKNYKDCLKFTFMLQWIVGWCSICILCLEQPFMEIWVGKELMFEDGMVFLCSLYLFISCICLIRSIYTQALGMWWTLRHLSIVDIFINTILNYVLVKYWGAYGIIVATILDITIVSIPWTTYYLFRDYFGLRFYFSYLWDYIKYLLVAIIVGVITFYICNFINYQSNLLEFVMKMFVCFIIPNLLYLLIFFNSKHFKEVIRFGERLRKSSVIKEE